MFKMIHKYRKRLYILVDEAEKIFDQYVFTAVIEDSKKRTFKTMISTAGMLMTGLKTILFSGTLNYKTEVSIDKASKAPSKSLNFDFKQRPKPRVTEVISCNGDERIDAVVKAAQSLVVKSSLIIVSSYRDDVDDIMTKENFPDVKIFLFTDEDVKTSTKYVDKLDEVNSYEGRVVIFCDLEFGRSSDFKPHMKANVLLTLEDPTYEQVVQGIGRGLRSIKAVIDVVLVVPKTNDCAKYEPGEVVDKLASKSIDDREELEYRAKLARYIHMKKIKPFVPEPVIKAVIDTLSKVDL